MAKYLFLILFSFISISSSAQIKKSQVVVYGDNEVSWAAAVQSARSGVNTLWLRNKRDIGNLLSKNTRLQVNSNEGLDAGLWAEFLQKTRGALKPTDSLSNLAKQDINPQVARNVLTGISDSLKNLNILYNIQVKSIKKAGKRWKIVLTNNDKLKVSAIIDASEDEALLKLIREQDLSSPKKEEGSIITPENIYNNTLYRTGVAVFEANNRPHQVPASLLLNTPAENFFVINEYLWLKKYKNEDINNLPIRIQSGQAIGAAAAYCAFFKTTNDKINLRTLQGELLAYHGQVIPYQDIKLNDPHFSAIQRIGATGILKGETSKENDYIRFDFKPKKTVSSKEIEAVILNLYTRSQIWFSDKDIEIITLGDLLSLIKFTALKGDELDADIKKGWNLRFHFPDEFNLTENLNRRQLAVLIDYYLKPFNVKVDEKGEFRY